MNITKITVFLIINAYFTVFGFKLGVENISEGFLQRLSSKKQLVVGLITNQSGKDQQGNRTVDILLKRGISVAFIGAPEHGFESTTLAETKIVDGKDAATGIPILSLYNGHTGTAFSEDTLSKVDAVFFDIQDAGMRHYTYISTLLMALNAVSRAQKPFVVLDRPNPLGAVMEGPLVEPPHASFISVAEIPLRHGMTVGELAHFFNTNIIEKPARLYVVPMKEYDRYHGIGNSLLAALSPNITHKDACYGYSFLGLLGEIRPFDVGLGTDNPFSLIGLPTSHNIAPRQWNQLALELKKYGIESQFHTYYSQRKKKELHGLKLHMPNINNVRAFQALLATVEFMMKNGIAVQFSDQFDKAAGTSLVRNYLLGAVDRATLENTIKDQTRSFLTKAAHSFYYMPRPELF